MTSKTQTMLTQKPRKKVVVKGKYENLKKEVVIRGRY